MLLFLAIAILGLAVVTWSPGGPVFALSVSWLICIGPIVLGFVDYDALDYAPPDYIWLIGGSVVAFAVGALLSTQLRPPRAAAIGDSYDWEGEFRRWWPIARACGVIAIIALLSMLGNLYLLSGTIFDLAELRALTLAAESASTLGRVGAITIWSCFFCFSFAVFFRHMLSPARLALLLVAVLGIGISALTSAGRQAPLQLILITLFLESVRRRRLGGSRSRGHVLRSLVIGGGVAYLLYVTINRVTVDVESKAEVFLRLFRASLSPGLDGVLLAFGRDVRDVIVEALLYVSHTPSLFAASAVIDFGGPYWGMMNFPFVMRQLEPVFGHSVAGALELKRMFIGTERVLGVGWDTALSGMIMDFGRIGMLAFMLVLGLISQWTWRGAKGAGQFPLVVLGVVMMVQAVYTPYLSAISDTNMFFLLVASFLFLAGFGRAGSRQPGRVQLREHPAR